MTDDQILTATEASRAFSELLHRVCYGGESFVIKKGQRLMARIAPLEEIREEAKPTAPAEAIHETTVAQEIPPEDPLPSNMTIDEAEFYRAWMEQVQKVDA